MRRRNLVAACLVTAMITLAAPATAVTVTTSARSYEWQIQSNTNLQRVLHVKPILSGSQCAKDYAIKRARWMRDHRQLKHSSMSTVMRACRFTAVAENIAYGYPNGGETVRAWMRSSAHRANILNSRYRLIGTGARRDSRGVWWAVEIFGRK